MSSTTINKVSQAEQVDYGSLVQAGLLAAGGSAAVNVAVFLIGDRAGVFPKTVLMRNNKPLGAGPVAAISVIAAVLATLVFATLGRFTKRPVRVFGIVGLGVFVLMLGSPFSIPKAPTGMIASLEVMHLLEALIVVRSLTTISAKK